jgi:predicted type IV restriction endonuclease
MAVDLIEEFQFTVVIEPFDKTVFRLYIERIPVDSVFIDSGVAELLMARYKGQQVIPDLTVGGPMEGETAQFLLKVVHFPAGPGQKVSKEQGARG